MDDKIKSEIIDREMTKFWKFCETLMKDCTNRNLTVPESLKEFSIIFLNNLKDLTK